MASELQTIGQRFRQRREAKGFSQRKLAEAMQVSRSHIQCIERGDNFSVTVLLEACRILEITPNELLGQDEERSPYLLRFADALQGLEEKEMEVLTSAAEGMRNGMDKQ